MLIRGYSVQTNESLGQGSFGKVFKCYKTSGLDKQIYSIKIISKEIKPNCNAKMTFENEITILKDLMKKTDSCENILKVIEVFEEEKQVCVISELCDMELFTEFRMLQKSGQWYSEQEQISIIRQIANGAKFLVQNNMIHRDIKPANILVKIDRTGAIERKIYKISDFGFCRKLEDLYKKLDLTRIGTSTYCAPQLLLPKEQFSGKCDIFSYGILFYQIIYQGFLPDFGFEDKNSCLTLRSRKFKCPPLKHERAKEIIDLLEGMIVFSEEERISFEEIFQNPICTKPIKPFQDSILVQFGQTLNPEQIRQKIEEIKKEKLNEDYKSKFERINKIINIFYRKFLLCKQVFSQFEKTFFLPFPLIEMAMYYILIIGKQQLIYSFGLVNGCVPDIHPSLIEDNDVPHLLDILFAFRKECEGNQIYNINIENIRQDFLSWDVLIRVRRDKLQHIFLTQISEISEQEKAEIASCRQNNKDLDENAFNVLTAQIKNHTDQQKGEIDYYLSKTKEYSACRVNLNNVCEQFKQILKNSKLKDCIRKLNQELKLQIEKVMEIEERFKVIDYNFMDLDSILEISQ